MLSRQHLLIISLPLFFAWIHMLIYMFPEILFDKEPLVGVAFFMVEFVVLSCPFVLRAMRIGPMWLVPLFLSLNYIATAWFYVWFIFALRLGQIF